jgi:hypothetical protein
LVTISSIQPNQTLFSHYFTFPARSNGFPKRFFWAGEHKLCFLKVIFIFFGLYPLMQNGSSAHLKDYFVQTLQKHPASEVFAKVLQSFLSFFGSIPFCSELDGLGRISAHERPLSANRTTGGSLL